MCPLHQRRVWKDFKIVIEFLQPATQLMCGQWECKGGKDCQSWALWKLAHSGSLYGVGRETVNTVS